MLITLVLTFLAPAITTVFAVRGLGVVAVAAVLMACGAGTGSPSSMAAETVDVATSGAMTLVYEGDYVWLSGENDHGEHSVFRVNVADRSVESFVPATAAPDQALISAHGSVWFSALEGGLLVVDATDLTETTLLADGGTLALNHAIATEDAVIVSQGHDLIRIDPRTMQTVAASGQAGGRLLGEANNKIWMAEVRAWSHSMQRASNESRRLSSRPKLMSWPLSLALMVHC